MPRKSITMHERELLGEVHALIEEKLFFYGNVHVGDGSRFVVTIDYVNSSTHGSGASLQISVTLFYETAVEVFEPELCKLGFLKDSSSCFIASYSRSDTLTLTESLAASITLRILRHALLFDDARLEDFELSTLKHDHRLMPWEVHSFGYYGSDSEEHESLEDLKGGEDE